MVDRKIGIEDRRSSGANLAARIGQNKTDLLLSFFWQLGFLSAGFSLALSVGFAGLENPAHKT